jgi:Hyaluronidase
MDSTLEVAKEMRPAAKWGFYGLPRCFNDDNWEYCLSAAQEELDQPYWLFFGQLWI